MIVTCFFPSFHKVCSSTVGELKCKDNKCNTQERSRGMSDAVFLLLLISSVVRCRIGECEHQRCSDKYKAVVLNAFTLVENIDRVRFNIKTFAL